MKEAGNERFSTSKIKEYESLESIKPSAGWKRIADEKAGLCKGSFNIISFILRVDNCSYPGCSD